MCFDWWCYGGCWGLSVIGGWVFGLWWHIRTVGLKKLSQLMGWLSKTCIAHIASQSSATILLI